MKPRLIGLSLLAIISSALIVLAYIQPLTVLDGMVIGVVFGIPALVSAAFFIFAATTSLAWVVRRYFLHLPQPGGDYTETASQQYRKAA
ncbi:MAG: hypothetical protein HY648_12485 [Acidobacteria bacterium]|nr:hypothetical protein [Acidobacteriota bacterium]